MSKNRLIRLTEQDLHNIIVECANRILNEQNSVGIYYRGGNLKENGFIWLTPQDYYAKEYAKEMVNPIIWKFEISTIVKGKRISPLPFFALLHIKIILIFSILFLFFYKK